MRKLLVVSFCILLCLTCKGKHDNTYIPKAETGVDLGAAMCNGAFRFTIGRQFARHWSIDGHHSFVLCIPGDGLSEEESFHYNEFAEEDIVVLKETDNRISGGIRFRYWLKEAFEGGYIMAGCSFGNRTGTDCTIGTGYAIKIWEGLRVGISYEIDLRRSCLKGSPKGNGLGLTISYIY